MAEENDEILEHTEDEPEEDGKSDEPEVHDLVIRRRLTNRLDRYLTHRFPRVSRTMVQRLIKKGKITVNGLPTKASYEAAAGDKVRVELPAPEPLELTPEDIPIDVVYEDDYILAVNKQTGIICHPANITQSGTLANALAFYSESLSKCGAAFRPGIVHRLDKNTSGIMLVAKTDEAHWRLGMQFERRTVHKTYMGIAEGNPSLDSDIIDQPLAAHPTIKDRYIVTGMPVRSALFKEAVTRYEVQERFEGFSFVHMFPKTGRTHQLRVHMSAIGYPLLGDSTYGGHFWSEKMLTGEGSDKPLLEFQALHAFRIEFTHPIFDKPMLLETPAPPVIQNILDLLRKFRSRK